MQELGSFKGGICRLPWWLRVIYLAQCGISSQKYFKFISKYPCLLFNLRRE
jgi:hypothetical protein